MNVLLALSLLSNPIIDDDRILDIPSKTSLSLFDPILNPQRELSNWDVIQESLGSFLWRHFHVVMIEDRQCYSVTQIYKKSMERHVALFRFEHDNLDNVIQEISKTIITTTKFPSINEDENENEDRDKGKKIELIKECSYLNLASDGSDQISDKQLDQLAGSQAKIKFKNIQYSWNGKRPSYASIQPDGSIRLISKIFKKEDDDEDSTMVSTASLADEDNGAIINGAKNMPNKNKNKKAINRKIAKTRKGNDNSNSKSKEIFHKELRALELLYNVKNILSPVCKDSKRLELLFPYLSVGDLIPLDSDDFVNMATSNPDDTFLPRFAYSLIQTVHEMHKAGIIHLDIKPENILVHGPDRLFYQHQWNTDTIKLYTPVLIDFGLSKLKNVDDMTACGRKGNGRASHIGTRCTMSPEQLACKGNVTEASDWWGIAATLWRIRIFWEPTLPEPERSRILSSQAMIGPDNIPILEDKPFFSHDFREMIKTIAQIPQENREFDKNINMLLGLDYVQRGNSDRVRDQMYI